MQILGRRVLTRSFSRTKKVKQMPGPEGEVVLGIAERCVVRVICVREHVCLCVCERVCGVCACACVCFV